MDRGRNGIAGERGKAGERGIAGVCKSDWQKEVLVTSKEVRNEAKKGRNTEKERV